MTKGLYCSFSIAIDLKLNDDLDLKVRIVPTNSTTSATVMWEIKDLEEAKAIDVVIYFCQAAPLTLRECLVSKDVFYCCQRNDISVNSSIGVLVARVLHHNLTHVKTINFYHEHDLVAWQDAIMSHCLSLVHNYGSLLLCLQVKHCILFTLLNSQ